MPPRKSNVSQVSQATAATEEGAQANTPGKEGLGIEDLSLPRTMVQRLSKGVLPPNTQIQKDALLAISKSATVFVNYLTAHANEQAQRMNKKTIQPKDVLDAIHDIEFDLFLPRLQAELDKYNSIQTDKRNSYRKKVREEQKTKSSDAEVDTSVISGVAPAAAGTEAEMAENDSTGDTNVTPIVRTPKIDSGNGEPRSKKARGDGGMEIDQDDDEDAPDDEVDEEEEDVEDDQEDEDENDDDGEDQFEDAKEELAEDLLEEKENHEMEDEALDEGNDSD